MLLAMLLGMPTHTRILGPILLVTLAVACGSTPARIEAPLLPEVDRSVHPSAPIARTPAPAETPKAAEADVPLDVAMRNVLVEHSARVDSPDGTLFRAGQEALARRDTTIARKTFFELIQNHPKSPFVPYAYLAFADMFFDESAGDSSKYALAKQAYHEVIKYPPPGNEAYAYALHRAGATSAATREFQQALDFQRKTIAALTQYKDLPLRDATLVSARRELVAAYAMAGAPDKAALFFKATDPDNANALVLALGDELVRRGSGREAIAVFDLAIRTNKSDETCAAAKAAYKTLADRADPPNVPMVARAEQQRQTLCR